MKQPLESLHMTVGLGLVLTLVMTCVVASAGYLSAMDLFQWPVIIRWLHVISGVMWIGLLWYLNFVQIPSMPKIPDEQKPAIGKVIAPATLWWFRWGAMATIVTVVQILIDHKSLSFLVFAPEMSVIYNHLHSDCSKL